MPRCRTRVLEGLAPLTHCPPASTLDSSAGSSRPRQASVGRSEEHTSELQSPCNLVCRLLLEKKKVYHGDSGSALHKILGANGRAVRKSRNALLPAPYTASTLRSRIATRTQTSICYNAPHNT